MSKKANSGKPKTMKLLVASLRRNATRAELILHGALQFALANYEADYVFQQAIGPYVADFFVGAANLVIEADGSAHDTPWAVAHDAERDRFIASKGYKIIRFENREIEHKLMETVDKILDECWDLPKAGTKKVKVPGVIVPSLQPVKITLCPPGSAQGSGPSWANWGKGYCGKRRK